jgi:hypothetical protein
MHIGLVMSVCPSVHVIQLENRWMDVNEIWYGCYATGDYPQIVLYNFLQSVIPTWRTNKLVRWSQHEHHLQQGHTVVYDEKDFRKIQNFGEIILCIM